MTRQPGPGAPHRPQDPLARLALLDPVDAAGARNATREGRTELAQGFVTGGTVVAVRLRRRSRGLAGLLVAATVATVVTIGTVVVDRTPGGVDGVTAAVAVLTDPGRVDRQAEREGYDTWVGEMVGCLRQQYGEAVRPLPGGFTVDWSELEPGPGGTTSFGNGACAHEVGDPPRPAPPTDSELGRHYVEQVALAGCLRGLGHDVAEGPSAQAYSMSWRDPSPTAPPWTPYASVDLADLRAAQEACGVPEAPAPPAWAAHDGPVLEGARRDVFGRRSTPAVAFVEPEAFHDRWAECLTDLGVAATSDGSSMQTQNSDTSLDALCHDRFPLRPDPGTSRAWQQTPLVYEHLVEQVLPCLREQGVEVPDPPTLEEYLLQSDSGVSWSPWSAVTSTDAGTREEMDALDDRCPRDLPGD